MLGYAVIFVARLPPILGIKDEVGFLNQALLWSRPELAAEVSSRPVEDILEIDGRPVSWRNPGRSLVLLPLLPFRSVGLYALTGLAFHLATTLLAAWLLERRGRSPFWAALVLFHPTLAIYSRTVMADGPAGTFVLLGILALERRRGGPLLAGVAFGCAAVFRYHVGILLPALAVYLLCSRRGVDRWKASGACLAGGGAVGMAIVLYNLGIYGRPLGFTGQGFWAPEYIVSNGAAYLFALGILWPCMLIAPLLHRGPGRGALWTTVLTLFATMLVYSWHDDGAGRLQTAVLSLRLLQPVLPLWIVAYAEVLEDRFAPAVRRLAPPGRRTAVLALAGAMLLVGQTILFQRHQRHLWDLVRARDQISASVPAGSLVVANGAVRKLFASLDATPPYYRWLPYDFDGKTPDWGDAIAAETGDWYLAILPKRPGNEFPRVLDRYLRSYEAERIEAGAIRLILYRMAAPSR